MAPMAISGNHTITYLTNCLNFWLNLLCLQVRFPDRVQLLICTNLFHSHSKIFVDSTRFYYVWCVSNMLQINSLHAWSNRVGWSLCTGNAHSLTTCVQGHKTYGSTNNDLHKTFYKDAENTIWHWNEATQTF